MKHLKSFKEKIVENNTPNIKTWGDLKRIINSIRRKKQLNAAKDQAKDLIIDQLAGLIPGAGNVKTAFGFFKSIYSANDSTKTNTWLDRINVDDKFSEIVDDSIEDKFLKALIKLIESKNDNELLPDDFDINKMLINFLSKRYDNRTLAKI